MKEKTNQEGKLKLKNKIGYAMGDMGNDLTLMMLQSYLLVFYTKVLGVPAAIIGTMFLVTKFVDAFTDTAMGRIIDSHTDKNGDRFRPWIRRMAVPLVVCSVLLYNIFIEGWPMWAKIAYVSVVYLLYGSFCYTGINIPYGAMASVLTTDPKEKASLSVFRTIGALFASVIISLVIPLIVYTKDANGNSVAVGRNFPILAIVFGLLALGCYYLCVRWSKEVIHVPNKPKAEKKGSLLADVRQVCSDRAVVGIIVISIAVFGMQSITQGLNQYLFLDYFNNTKYLSIASLLMMGSMLIVAPFSTKISAKVGKKEGSIIGFAIGAAVYAVLLVARVQNPVIYLVGTFFSCIGIGYFAMIMWAMISDCIDNYYVEHGVRQDGTIYAIYSFIKKLAGAVTGSFAAWSLAWIHYDEKATVQTAAVSESIYTISMVIPLICMLLAMVFTIFLYPLNRKKVEENAMKLKEMAEKEGDLVNDRD